MVVPGSPRRSPLGRRVQRRHYVHVSTENGSSPRSARNLPVRDRSPLAPTCLRLFSVSGQLVSGLKYLQVVKRAGINVDKMEAMIGSYPPKSDAYAKVVSPHAKLAARLPAETLRRWTRTCSLLANSLPRKSPRQVSLGPQKSDCSARANSVRSHALRRPAANSCRHARPFRLLCRAIKDHG